MFQFKSEKTDGIVERAILIEYKRSHKPMYKSNTRLPKKERQLLHYCYCDVGRAITIWEARE